MVTRTHETSYTIEEAASFLNRAPWFVAGAIAGGDLVPGDDGRLTHAALLAFMEGEAQRDAALREVFAESEDAGLDAPEIFDRLVALGIVDPEEGGGRDR